MGAGAAAFISVDNEYDGQGWLSEPATTLVIMVELMDDQGRKDEELEALDERIRQMQERAEGLTQKRRSEDLDFDEHFDTRLSSLESKAQSAKSVREGQKADMARVQRADNESGRGLGIGLTVAYMIIGVPMFGALIGWLIDKQVGGVFWKGICTTLGAILGVTLAIMTINKANANPPS